jgi:murein DD-endopeptidase MepM/ murein hydrolase activator NlpD
MKNFLPIILNLFVVINCYNFSKEEIKIPLEKKYLVLFQNNPEYISDGFDYPVGKPNGVGYSDAQPFQQNFHLGEDWIKNGRREMGAPIYATSNGYVYLAEDVYGGWGQVIMIVHLTKENLFYVSLYGHLQKIRVQEDQFVKKGDMIGTMGDANGVYWVHLHFEIRDDIYKDIGPGYSGDTKGYLNPKKFINKNRKI